MPKTVLITRLPPRRLWVHIRFATEAGGLVFLSGQVGLDPITGERTRDDVSEQAHRVMKNIGGNPRATWVLATAISSRQQYSWLTSPTIPTVNEVYGSYFSGCASGPISSAGRCPAGWVPGGNRSDCK